MIPPEASKGADADKVAEEQFGIDPGLRIEIVGTTLTVTVVNTGKKHPLEPVPLTE